QPLDPRGRVIRLGPGSSRFANANCSDRFIVLFARTFDFNLQAHRPHLLYEENSGWIKAYPKYFKRRTGKKRRGGDKVSCGRNITWNRHAASAEARWAME